jgi:hypothetical protein
MEAAAGWTSLLSALGAVGLLKPLPHDHNSPLHVRIANEVATLCLPIAPPLNRLPSLPVDGDRRDAVIQKGQLPGLATSVRGATPTGSTNIA